MKSLAEKSRSRSRIGADTARVWARELRLGNPYAKSIMLALANYMNEDGSAFPGMETLARDTDISEDTVIARLRWLEGIGAIALLKSWIDEHGRRNYDGRGRQTSHEIRFLFDADIEIIEEAARAGSKPTQLRGAAARSHGAKAEINPRPHRVLNESQEQGVSTGLAPEQPPTAAARTEYLITDSPQSPPLPSEAEQTEPIETGIPYQQFVEAYGEGSVRPQQARTLWSALNETERDTAIRGAKGYRTQRLATKKPLIDPERFLRNRDLWTEFAGSAIAKLTERISVDAESDAGRALLMLHTMAKLPRPQATETGGRSMLSLAAEVPAAVLALLTAPPEKQWGIVEPGSNEFGAWKGFIADHTGKMLLVQRYTTDAIFQPDKDGKPVFAGYTHREGLKVPAPFPPRVDGAWPEVESTISKAG